MKSITGSAKCQTYDKREDVFKAVRKAVRLAGGFPNVKGKKVLIKPNLLSDAAPERAVTTHPQVIWAVAKLVQDAGGIVTIADSPGAGILYTPRTLHKVYSKCGIDEVAKELGITLDYDVGFKECNFPEGVVM
ncbi:MAG: DUF362 domain-containing protein, partial [Methanocorpusculum sp.]|nr:DUF362 domain-containing protein [Methanocorpusculum sp.]